MYPPELTFFINNDKTIY